MGYKVGVNYHGIRNSGSDYYLVMAMSETDAIKKVKEILGNISHMKIIFDATKIDLSKPYFMYRREQKCLSNSPY